MIESVKSKGGRPPLGPKSGKGATLATRITAETRQALDEEASRTGRSISQVVEIWLDEARRGRAQLHELLRGHTAAAAIETLVEIARTIHTQVANRDLAMIALRAAWIKAVPELLPRALKPMDDLMKDVEQIQSAWLACSDVVGALDQAGESDPAYIRSMQSLYSPDNSSSQIRVADRLRDLLDIRNPAFSMAAFLSDNYRMDHEHVLLALETLSQAGGAVQPKIEHAMTLIRDFLRRDDEFYAQLKQWNAYGAYIADVIIGVAK